MPNNITLQLKGATIDRWFDVNPVLASREIGFVLDATGKIIAFKVGDGKTRWNALDYFVPGKNELNEIREKLDELSNSDITLQNNIDSESERAIKEETNIKESISSILTDSGIYSTDSSIILKSLDGEKVITVDDGAIKISNNPITATNSSVFVGNDISASLLNANSSGNTLVGNKTAIGDSSLNSVSDAVAIGNGAKVYRDGAVQIGNGENYTADSFQFKDTLIVIPAQNSEYKILSPELTYRTLLELGTVPNISTYQNYPLLPTAAQASLSAGIAEGALYADQLSEKGMSIVNSQIKEAVENQALYTDNERENVSIGANATEGTNAWGGSTIGYSTKLGKNVIRGTALGYGARIVIPSELESYYRLGEDEVPTEKNYFNAIQLGQGTNSTPNSLQFFNVNVITATNMADPSTYKINGDLLKTSLNGLTLESVTAENALSADYAKDSAKLEGKTVDEIIDLIDKPYYNDSSTRVTELGTGLSAADNDRLIKTINIGNNNVGTPYTDIGEVIAIGQNSKVSDSALKGSILIGNDAEITAKDSIQLGKGRNIRDKTLQVFDCTVLEYDNTLSSYYMSTPLLTRSIGKIDTLALNSLSSNTITYSTISPNADSADTASITAANLTTKYFSSDSANIADFKMLGNVMYVEESEDNGGFQISGGRIQNPINYKGAWLNPTDFTVIRYVDLIKYLDEHGIPLAQNAERLDQAPNIMVGKNAIASNNSTAIGFNAEAVGENSIAIGNKIDLSIEHAIATARNSIQLGTGTNRIPDTLQVYGNTILSSISTTYPTIDKDLLYRSINEKPRGGELQPNSYTELSARVLFARRAETLGGINNTYANILSAASQEAKEDFPVSAFYRDKSTMGYWTATSSSTIVVGEMPFVSAAVNPLSSSIRIGFDQVCAEKPGISAANNTIAIGSDIGSYGDDYIFIGNNQDGHGGNIQLGHNLSINAYDNSGLNLPLSSFSNNVFIGNNLRDPTSLPGTNFSEIHDSVIIGSTVSGFSKIGTHLYDISGSVFLNLPYDKAFAFNNLNDSLVFRDQVVIRPNSDGEFVLDPMLVARSIEDYIYSIANESSVFVGKNINVNGSDPLLDNVIDSLSNTLVIGSGASAVNNSTTFNQTVVGNFASARGSYSIALGQGAKTNYAKTIAIGQNMISDLSGGGGTNSELSSRFADPGFTAASLLGRAVEFRVFGLPILDFGLQDGISILNGKIALSKELVYDTFENYSTWPEITTLSSTIALNDRHNIGNILSGVAVEGAYASKLALSSQYSDLAVSAINTLSSSTALSSNYAASSNLVSMLNGQGSAVYEPLSSAIGRVIYTPVLSDQTSASQTIDLIKIGTNQSNNFSQILPNGETSSLNGIFIGNNVDFNAGRPGILSGTISIGSNIRHSPIVQLPDVISSVNGIVIGNAGNFTPNAYSVETLDNSILMGTKLDNTNNYLKNSVAIIPSTAHNNAVEDLSVNELKNEILIGPNAYRIKRRSRNNPASVQATRILASPNSIYLTTGLEAYSDSSNGIIYVGRFDNTIEDSLIGDTDGKNLIAIGDGVFATDNSIQLGRGVNRIPWTFNVYNCNVLSGSADTTGIDVSGNVIIDNWKINEALIPIKTSINIEDVDVSCLKIADAIIRKDGTDSSGYPLGMIAIGDGAEIVYVNENNSNLIAIGNGAEINAYYGQVTNKSNIIQLGDGDSMFIMQRLRSKLSGLSASIPANSIPDSNTTDVLNVWNCNLLYRNGETYYLNPDLLSSSISRIVLDENTQVGFATRADSANVADALAYSYNGTSGEVSAEAGVNELLDIIGVKVNRDNGSIVIGNSIIDAGDDVGTSRSTNSIIIGTSATVPATGSTNFVQIGNPTIPTASPDNTVRIFDTILMQNTDAGWKIPSDLYQDLGAYYRDNTLYGGQLESISGFVSTISSSTDEGVGGIALGKNISPSSDVISDTAVPYSVAIGNNMAVGATNAIAIGKNVISNGPNTLAIGAGDESTIARSTNDIAIGAGAQTGTAGEVSSSGNRIQIGTGVNTTNDTLQVGNTTVLMGDGAGNYTINPNIIGIVSSNVGETITILDQGDFREIIGKSTITSRSVNYADVSINGFNNTFEVCAASIDGAIDRTNVQVTLSRNMTEDVEANQFELVVPLVTNLKVEENASEPGKYDLKFRVYVLNSERAQTLDYEYIVNYTVKFAKSNFSKSFLNV